MAEIALTFPNSRGETLVGVYHQPSTPPKAALVMLHGWSGTRTGPHQMLARAARRFCEAGYAVLRFDFAGRGDSDGDTELATLATMKDDTDAAFAWLRTQTEAPLWLVGLCSGCEIAVAAVEEKMEGAILWSAPIFAALPEESGKSAKRTANWKKYARKLFNPATYLKILRGEVDTKSVKTAMAGGGGAAHKNIEGNAAGQLPRGFRSNSLKKFQTFQGEIWQIYGGADPILDSARQWYATNCASSPRVHLVEGANHSFYGLAWENEVLGVTLDWLEAWSASQSKTRPNR